MQKVQIDKYILIIGGSELQIPTIKFAKSLGLKIILTDKDPNPPCKELADFFANISASDEEGLIKFAKESSEKYFIIGAFCNSDFGIRSVALVNKALNLKALDVSDIKLCLDKNKCNEILSNRGLPVPKGFTLNKVEDYKFSKIKFPLIIKPVNSSGSRGVNYVKNIDSFEKYFNKSKRFSDQVYIEEAIVGDHIDVSGFFANNCFYPGGILNRYFSEYPECYPIFGFQPPMLDVKLQKEIYKLVENASRALNISYGPVKGDLIISKNGPIIIEISPRFHGDISSGFVCDMTYKTNPILQWMEFLSSGSLPKNDLFFKSKCVVGWAAIFPSRTGIIKSIEVDKTKEIKGIKKIIIQRQKGWKINSLGDNDSLIGFILAKAISHEKVDKILKAATSSVRIIFQD